MDRQALIEKLKPAITLVDFPKRRLASPISSHPGIVQHHMGEGSFTNDKRNPVLLVNAMHLALLQSTGENYSMIGYNFMVDQQGTIYQGRGLHYRGGHAAQKGVADFNNWLGVNWFGGLGDTPTPQALESLAKLYAWVSVVDNFPLTRDHIIGHKETKISTACPGNIFQYLDSIVERARQLKNEAEKGDSKTTTPTPPLITKPNLSTLSGTIDGKPYDFPVIDGKSYVHTALVHKGDLKKLFNEEKHTVDLLTEAKSK